MVDTNMNIPVKHPELLSPAGDFERLVAAIDYGADAVYLGGEHFGMRAGAPNFTNQGLCDAVAYAHGRGVRVYLTCNTLPTNEEIDAFPEFIRNAAFAKVDAVIASDIGVLSLIKHHTPNMEVHISTQAGIVNYAAANAFYEMGAQRVVLARELSLENIAEIRAKTPAALDIEAFVHGAMCVSFSGRCLLSSYIVNRDANRGECAQPCRWGYYLMEEKRPNEFYKIYEDDKGTYILNAKDMCMLDHIDKLAAAGITSLKIEGRAKSSYYVSVITNAYRLAIDTYLTDPSHFDLPQWVREEVSKVSHRKYCTGFYFGHPKDCQYYENSGYIRSYDVVAMIDECKDGVIYATQRNKFSVGDEVEILAPKQPPVKMQISQLFGCEGNELYSAPHAMMKLQIPSNSIFPTNSIIRKQLQPQE